MARKEGLKMPNDPRHDPAVVALANELATLEPVALRDRLKSVETKSPAEAGLSLDPHPSPLPREREKVQADTVAFAPWLTRSRNT